MAHCNRVVVLVDMDCFYCQVEEKLDPTLEGKPIAVVQYNAWRGGGIIAVNYPARDRGVTRHMRGDDAKKVCPEIMLPMVPSVRGKADLTKYREAGQKVADVLQTFTPLLERASIDEAYLDITDVVKKRLLENSAPVTIDKVSNTYVVGHDISDFLHNLNTNTEFSESNQLLAVGGMIVEEIRREVFIKTGYKCSAGIAHNKILAKLVCGLHKPNKQTILPEESVSTLYKDLPIKKIKSLGGKYGRCLAEELNISMMGELIKFSEKELIKKFDAKNGTWLYNIARGIDLEPVTTKLVSKSIGCCKRFPGKSCLRKPEQVEHWINELATEISERLEKDLEENKRRAKQMVVSFAQVVNGSERSSSRTYPLNSYIQSRIAKDSMEVIKKYCRKIDDCYSITFLGISVGNFEEFKNKRSISSFFKNVNVVEPKVGKDIQINENNTEKTSFELNLQDSVLEQDKENDVENLSIYSATTEELDEDPKSYIYYEDVFPSSVSEKPFENSHLEGKLEIQESENTNETNIPGPKSFFGKYFDESTTSSSSIEVPGSHEKNGSQEQHNSSIISENDAYTEENTDTYADKQKCLDCNKQIFLSEMSAHMDYHFALKLVRSEAHLYNPQMPQKSCTSSEANDKKSHIKKTNSKTRKPAGGSLSRFFQLPAQGTKRKTSDQILLSNEVDGQGSEFCPECSKKVSLEDKVSHEDYHLAKKLQAELNATMNIDRNHKNVSILPKDKKTSDISMYFNKK